MTFWALGKVKNITEKLNLKDYKDYGTKIIKSYIQKEDQTTEFFDIKQAPSVHSKESSKYSHSSKQQYKTEQWLSIQIQEYRKLQLLQEKLLKRHEEQQKQRLEKEYTDLQDQLNRLKKQQEQQMQKIQKQKLRNRIKTGQSNIRDLIKENMRMREEIQREKVLQTHQN